MNSDMKIKLLETKNNDIDFTIYINEVNFSSLSVSLCGKNSIIVKLKRQK